MGREDLLELVRAHREELRAVIERCRPDAPGRHAPARTAALVEHGDGMPGALEHARGRQPGDSGTDDIEPYLLREQYIIRSPRGRMALPRAFTLLGRTPPKPKAEDRGPTLFE